MKTAWVWVLLLAILFVAMVLFFLVQIRPYFETESLPWVQRSMDILARKGQQCRILRTEKDGPNVVEIVSPSCEDGLPHTVRPHTIRMTEEVWNSSRKETILVHERVHLQQRQNPETWRRFYEEHWGYTFPDDVPPEVANRTDIRANPDTADSPFPVWQQRYWFVEVYDDPVNPALRHSHVEIWDTRTQSWLRNPPVEWQRFFCEDSCPHQIEHPHELAAEYSTDSTWNCPAAITLREFQKRYQT
jgi:hypothetical protein